MSSEVVMNVAFIPSDVRRPSISYTAMGLNFIILSFWLSYFD